MIYKDRQDISRWEEVGFVTENHENDGITVKQNFTVIPLFP
jgi:hypothetical protein